MSNDSEAVPTGKPVSKGIKSELHKVPGTPFVDWRPETDEEQMVRFMMGPLANVAAKIDNRLAALEGRIAALQHRIDMLEENQRVADALKAKRRKK
jgi:hypothetical protein